MSVEIKKYVDIIWEKWKRGMKDDDDKMAMMKYTGIGMKLREKKRERGKEREREREREKVLFVIVQRFDTR